MQYEQLYKFARLTKHSDIRLIDEVSSGVDVQYFTEEMCVILNPHIIDDQGEVVGDVVRTVGVARPFFRPDIFVECEDYQHLLRRRRRRTLAPIEGSDLPIDSAWKMSCSSLSKDDFGFGAQGDLLNRSWDWRWREK